MLIPSIDLYNGQAVQWRQGKEKILARDDVFGVLEQFSLYGEVALIDLNAALGEGDNSELIKKLLKQRSCRVGGGIRSKEKAIDYLKAGASKIIVGTCAMEPWVATLPRDAIVIAIDAKADELVVNGWRDGTGQEVLSVLPKLTQRCSELLYTQVLKEGMMQGMDRERIREIVDTAQVPVTVAGGVTSPDDLTFLRELGANAQIGMAIYTGALSLGDALVASIDFKKQGLIPTIVQDYKSHEVLMLAWSSEESLRLALQQRNGIYWSRSRQKLWRKGEESGHSQTLQRVDFDCDGDSLIFQVTQTHVACHLQRWSCFPSQRQRFALNSLDNILMQRQISARDKTNLSYTEKVLSDPALQIEKLREECEELIEAVIPDHVRWEAADLLYFALINARAKGISLSEIENELRARQRNESGVLPA